VVISTAVQWAGSQLDAAGAGGDAVVDEVAVHHLGQGRTGPVRGTAREVTGSGAVGGRRVVRVELVDTGIERGSDAGDASGDGRLMAVAHVGLCTTRSQV
jgi:hypothetical protein